MTYLGDSPLEGDILKLNLIYNRRVANRLTIDAPLFATCI